MTFVNNAFAKCEFSVGGLTDDGLFTRDEKIFAIVPRALANCAALRFADVTSINSIKLDRINEDVVI